MPIENLKERLAIIYGLVTSAPSPDSISNEEMLAKIAAMFFSCPMALVSFKEGLNFDYEFVARPKSAKADFSFDLNAQRRIERLRSVFVEHAIHKQRLSACPRAVRCQQLNRHAVQKPIVAIVDHP
jgi:hypothetical protein